MTFVDINLAPSPRMLRQFAGACLVLLGALAVSRWLHGSQTSALVYGALAAGIGVTGLIRPSAVRWIFVASTVATFPVGWVVSNVMLFVLFAGVITPVAILFKLRGRDRLWRRQMKRPTYWKPRSASPNAERYLRQY